MTPELAKFAYTITSSPGWRELKQALLDARRYQGADMEHAHQELKQGGYILGFQDCLDGIEEAARIQIEQPQHYDDPVIDPAASYTEHESRFNASIRRGADAIAASLSSPANE